MLKKSNSNLLVGVIHGFFGVFMLIAVFIPSEIRLTMTGVVVVSWLLINVFFIVPELLKDSRLQWEEGNRVIGDIQMKFLPIEVVDQRLQQLADELTALCQKQVQFRNAESAVAKAKAIEEEIARAKSAFWSAHALAKELGYVMKGHVSDYASAPKAPVRRSRRVV